MAILVIILILLPHIFVRSISRRCVDVDVTGNITAKLCEVWSELKKKSTLVTMATAAILNLFKPQKLRYNLCE
jgi:hypothetical protein